MREIQAQMAALPAAEGEFESGSCKQRAFALATGTLVTSIQTCLLLVLTKNCALNMRRFS